MSAIEVLSKTSLKTLASVILLSTMFFSASSRAETLPDEVIINAQILTMNNNREQFDNGYLAVKENKILALGSMDEMPASYSEVKTLDAHQAILLPGMVNAHQHIPMIAFRGLGEEGIANRLVGYFFPLENKFLSPDMIYRATKLGAADLALSGVTLFADMYYYTDSMAKAVQEVGIRAILGETIIQYPTAVGEPYAGFDYAVKVIEEDQANPNALTRIGFAPHAPHTISKEMLEKVRDYVDEKSTPILIHAAEGPDEGLRIKDNPEGLSSVAYLDSVGVLRDETILAHSTHIEPEDIPLIKARGASISHNPFANAKGATGVLDLLPLLEAGVDVGIGTDGPMSTNQVGLFASLTYVSTLQRLLNDDRTIMPPETIIYLATMGGARALNREEDLGSLEVGKLADLILVETDSLNMQPNYEPYATLVFQANSNNVRDVMVNGEWVVQNKELVKVDQKRIVEDMEELKAEIKPFALELAIQAKKEKDAYFSDLEDDNTDSGSEDVQKSDN